LRFQLLAELFQVLHLEPDVMAAILILAAEAAATRTMGSVGASFVVLTILASTFGTTNSTVMTGRRLTFAQARDGLFFRPFGKIHPAFQTPHIGVVIFGFISAPLTSTIRVAILLAGIPAYYLWRQ
jgi:amino acid transporter